MEYQQAIDFQNDVLNKRIQGMCPDTLILCEHLPVFTLGRLGSITNILAGEERLRSQGLPLIRTNRGGDITFHGPGQLVVYPIFDLTKRKKDLRYYLNKLEEVIIEFLKDFGCFAGTKDGFTGVWFKERKIASIGIGVKKWVSFHGLAVNVNTDLGLFSLIKPCGLNVKMTSLSQILNHKVNMETVKRRIIAKFETVFGLNLNMPY